MKIQNCIHFENKNCLYFYYSSSLQKEIRINNNILKTICIDSDNLLEESTVDKDSDEVEGISVGELEIQLKDALLNENYEEAAYLRDLIEKMNAENEK